MLLQLIYWRLYFILNFQIFLCIWFFQTIWRIYSPFRFKKILFTNNLCVYVLIQTRFLVFFSLLLLKFFLFNFLLSSHHNMVYLLVYIHLFLITLNIFFLKYQTILTIIRYIQLETLILFFCYIMIIPIRNSFFFINIYQISNRQIIHTLALSFLFDPSTFLIFSKNLISCLLIHFSNNLIKITFFKRCSIINKASSSF